MRRAFAFSGVFNIIVNNVFFGLGRGGSYYGRIWFVWKGFDNSRHYPDYCRRLVFVCKQNSVFRKASRRYCRAKEEFQFLFSTHYMYYYQHYSFSHNVAAGQEIKGVVYCHFAFVINSFMRGAFFIPGEDSTPEDTSTA